MRVHDLKTESKHFRDVWEGKKKAEIRKDDRGYEVGDGLMLWETKGGETTGSRLLLIITHILRNVPEYGLQDGYCILSFKHAGEEQEVGSTVGNDGTQYSDVDVRCPCFKAANDTKKTLICEGAMDGTRIRFSLRQKKRYDTYRRCFCESDYESCPYYRAVEERYDE